MIAEKNYLSTKRQEYTSVYCRFEKTVRVGVQKGHSSQLKSPSHPPVPSLLKSSSNFFSVIDYLPIKLSHCCSNQNIRSSRQTRTANMQKIKASTEQELSENLKAHCHQSNELRGREETEAYSLVC